MRKTIMSGALALVPALLALAAGLASAQGYPDKPIKLVVPWPPGGITDAAGRINAQRLSEKMKAPGAVANRGGAAGAISAELVALPPAAGYTLLPPSAPTHRIAPDLHPEPPYDPQ